jgi:hypothetical protein
MDGTGSSRPPPSSNGQQRPSNLSQAGQAASQSNVAAPAAPRIRQRNAQQLVNLCIHKLNQIRATDQKRLTIDTNNWDTDNISRHPTIHYPAFSGRFANFQEAHAYVYGQPKWTPENPEDDEVLQLFLPVVDTNTQRLSTTLAPAQPAHCTPAMLAAQAGLVQMLYNSMVDFTDFMDNIAGSSKMNKLLQRRYSPHHVEATCWIVLVSQLTAPYPPIPIDHLIE